MLSPNETSPTESNTSQGTVTGANFEQNMEGHTESALIEKNEEENTKKEEQHYSDLVDDQIDISSALVNKAREGDGNVLCYIGSMYHHRQQYEKALVWLQLAVEKNNPGAMYMIATMHEKGDGIELDPLESLSLYLKAASLGDFLSCLSIASVFERGHGVIKDYQRAADWYMQSGSDIPEGDGYVNITQTEKPIENLIIETMQTLEQERERRWRSKVAELEVETQTLSEEVISLRNLVNEIFNSRYTESRQTEGRGRRHFHNYYADLRKWPLFLIVSQEIGLNEKQNLVGI
ncbi:HCP-like protein [Backusella circina FSU 941]|nr:HCP-like protein [Backusella circina FSU 941]